MVYAEVKCLIWIVTEILWDLCALQKGWFELMERS